MPRLPTIDAPLDSPAAGGRRHLVPVMLGVLLAWGCSDPAEGSANFVPTGDGAFALGENHTCLLADAAGHVRCWGYNSNQVLGVGSTDAVANGIVVDVAGAQALAAGDYHTCALLDDATVKCWGSNSYGQVGDGTSGNVVTSAVAVPGLADVTGIFADSGTTCASVADGRVLCWGQDDTGGGATPIVSPTEVAALAGATTVAVGAYHVCGLVDAGVACAGTLAAATFVGPVTDLSSGWQHSCAVSGGAAYCWGDGYLGAIGDGLTNGGYRPLRNVGVTGTVVAVRTGGYHSCALTLGGDLWCWGNNQGGAIDPDAPHEPGYLPAVVASGVQDFDVGDVHVCVTDGSGFHCWGNDWAGAVTGTPPP
jgi:hypothetical protein